MSEHEWEAPIVELSRNMCAYIVWLLANDLKEWGPHRRTRLSRDDAAGLALFLCDHLPDMRIEIDPAEEPALKVV